MKPPLANVGGSQSNSHGYSPSRRRQRGFIADSEFDGNTVINGSQQQWLVRNSKLDAGATASGTRCSRAS